MMYEPIAYVPADEGRILCPTHAHEYADATGTTLDDATAFGAVFDGAEADYLPTCDVCGDVIDGYTLTSDGIAYYTRKAAHAVVKEAELLERQAGTEERHA